MSSFSKRSRRSRRIYTELIAPAYVSTALVKGVSLRPEPRVTLSLNLTAAKLLITPTRDAMVASLLREAHRRIGWYLATTFCGRRGWRRRVSSSARPGSPHKRLDFPRAADIDCSADARRRSSDAFPARPVRLFDVPSSGSTVTYFRRLATRSII